jgi:hypothetical protein
MRNPVSGLHGILRPHALEMVSKAASRKKTDPARACAVPRLRLLLFAQLRSELPSLALQAGGGNFERLAMKNKPTKIIVVHSEYGEFTAPGFSDGLNGWCSDKRYAEGREARREQFFNERKK